MHCSIFLKQIANITMQSQSAIKKNVAIFLSAITCLAIGRYFQLPFFLFLFPVFGMPFLRCIELLPDIMRGFYAGRFRDKDLLAMQAEYRKHLVGNRGLVLFAGAGKVSNSIDGINLKDLQHSLGFGFRRTISKQHHLNLRMDVG